MYLLFKLDILIAKYSAKFQTYDLQNMTCVKRNIIILCQTKNDSVIDYEM